MTRIYLLAAINCIELNQYRAAHNMLRRALVWANREKHPKRANIMAALSYIKRKV